MSKRTYRALLVANSTFPKDRYNLPDLEGPRNDPAVLRDALCDDLYGLFPSDNVRLVIERPMPEVLEETETFLRSANRDDTLLLYYSGHGQLDLSNELYLCARDSRVDLLRSTAVKASDLRAMIDDSAAATTVVILDCCHSGAFKGGSLAEKLMGQGRFVLTSCRTGVLANDASASNHASLFTHHLVQGMLGRATDHDGDGLVVLEDLYRYTHDRLTAEGRQIPQRSFAGSGDVPMARCPGPSNGNRKADSSAAEVGHQDLIGTGAGTETVVVNPSVAEPVLDVSPTEIVLEDVGAEEDLPPERVAVINRGGGELAWSAECQSEWVILERDQHGLLLQLRPPQSGTNRANLYIRDDNTGGIKTVRLIVRVVAPATTAASAEKPERDRASVGPHRIEASTQTKTPTAAPGTTSSRDPRPAVVPGWRWKLRHSSWLLATLLPMGFTTWAGFLYVGLRAKRRSWSWTAAAYGVAAVALVAWIVTGTDADGNFNSGWQNNVGFAVWLTLWVGGFIHGLLVNVHWLKWRAGARQTPAAAVEDDKGAVINPRPSR